MPSGKDNLKDTSRISNSHEQGTGKDSSQGTLDAKYILNALKDKARQFQKLPSSKIGVPEGWRRVTVIMQEDYYERLKELSYCEKITIKNILDAVLENFLSSVNRK